MDIDYDSIDEMQQELQPILDALWTDASSTWYREPRKDGRTQVTSQFSGPCASACVSGTQRHHRASDMPPGHCAEAQRGRVPPAGGLPRRLLPDRLQRSPVLLVQLQPVQAGRRGKALLHLLRLMIYLGMQQGFSIFK